MLHTINKSPFLYYNLESCLRFAKDGDPIIFYEDGVYAVAAGTKVESMMKNALKKHPIYAIEADVKARGYNKGFGRRLSLRLYLLCWACRAAQGISVVLMEKE